MWASVSASTMALPQLRTDVFRIAGLPKVGFATAKPRIVATAVRGSPAPESHVTVSRELVALIDVFAVRNPQQLDDPIDCATPATANAPPSPWYPAFHASARQLWRVN